MGFFQEFVKPENLALTAFGGLGAGVGRAALYDNPAGAQGQTDSSPLYRMLNGGDNHGLGVDIASPQDYNATINQAFANLGQPGGNQPGRDKITADYVRSLTSAFVDSVYNQTGSAPTADQVKQFVAQNASVGNAQKFVQGQLTPDQVTGMASDYLKGNPDALTNPGTVSSDQQRIQGLTDQVNKLYDTGKQNYIQNYDQSVYTPAKTNTTNDLAGQGLLTQPTSRYALDQIDANRGRDISSGLNTLENQKAQGNIDISKTIENLLQQNQNRATQNYQFNKQFNAGQDQQAYNNALQNKGLDIASQIGRLQAGNNKKGWEDYLNTGLNVAGTGAKVFSLFSGNPAAAAAVPTSGFNYGKGNSQENYYG